MSVRASSGFLLKYSRSICCAGQAKSFVSVRPSFARLGVNCTPHTLSGLNCALVPRTPELTCYRMYSSNDPKLPSKQEVVNSLFKIIALIWDLTSRILIWSWATFKKYIVYNPTVQYYWKQFQGKLEQGRKS